MPYELVTADQSADTRKANCREYYRYTFVDKFEGYRPATEDEIASGNLPENYSYIQVGRGHTDRIEKNPFPEPEAPGTTLSSGKYSYIEYALLNQNHFNVAVTTNAYGTVLDTKKYTTFGSNPYFSKVWDTTTTTTSVTSGTGNDATTVTTTSTGYLPLVEYYRRDVDRVVAARLDKTIDYGDFSTIDVSYGYLKDQNGLQASPPPAVGSIEFSGQKFFYDSVSDTGSCFRLNLRAGQYNQVKIRNPSSITVTITSIGAVPWTSYEVNDLALRDCNMKDRVTPRFQKGFFLATYEVMFLDAVFARLKPTFLTYDPCVGKANTIHRVYKYSVIGGGADGPVFLRTDAGAYAYLKSLDGGTPVASENECLWLQEDETMHTVGEEDYCYISGPNNFTDISKEGLAKACAYTNAVTTTLTANNEVSTESVPYVFSIRCTTEPVAKLAIGEGMDGNWSPYAVKCSAAIGGGWIAPCSGKLYLYLYSKTYISSDRTIYPFAPYTWSRGTCYPDFSGGMQVRAYKCLRSVDAATGYTTYSASEDCGVVPESYRNMGAPFNGMLAISVVAGNCIRFGPAILGDSDANIAFAEEDLETTAAFVTWLFCDADGNASTVTADRTFTCRQDYKAGAIFVPNDWTALASL